MVPTTGQRRHMNFLKRAIRSVARQKSKSLILFTVIFVLGNILAGSVIIQQSTQHVEKITKEQMGAIATVGIDWNDKEIQKEFEDPSPDMETNLDVKLIKKVGASPYIKYYDYSESSGFQSKNLKLFNPSGDKKDKADDKTEDKAGGFTLMEQFIPIRGVQNPKIMDISLNKIKLVEGSVFTEEDIQKGNKVVLISKEFASKNGLHVGDEMTIDQLIMSGEMNENPNDTSDKETYDTQVEVVGLYQVLETVQKKSGKSGKSSKADSGSVVHAASISGSNGEDGLDFQMYNTFYMPNKTVHEMNQGYMGFLTTKSPGLFSDMSEKELAESAKPFYVPVYQLKSIDDLAKFKADTKPLLPKFYSVMTSTDNFDTIAGQFSKLSKIAKVVIIAAVSLSIILILLIVLLFMRDRKRELGIYLSLGDKKSTIILQIMIEVLTIAIIALMLSLVTGKFLGSFASDAFLQSNSVAKTNTDTIGDMMSQQALFSTGNRFSAESVLENYSVSFTPFYIVTYLLVGLATVMISVLLSTLYIFKLKPKKILLG